MKCNKCKSEFKKDSKFCTKCGNKISVPIIIIINIVNIFLYVLSSIFFIICLSYLNKETFLTSLLIFISSAFICPLTYRIITKYIKQIDKVYLRVIIIIFAFFAGLIIAPVDEDSINKEHEHISQNEILNENQNTKNEEQNVKEDEDKKITEQKAKEAEEKRIAEQKAKEAEEKRIAEEKAKEEQKRQEELRIKQEKEERIKNGETELSNGKFTLKAGHKGYFDGFGYYIEGEIKNNTNRKYSYVQVEFNVYDSNGVQLGSAIDNINNLEANGTWKFKAFSFDNNSQDVVSYKVIDVSAF